ncbi:DUF3078 domain-containing protein [Kaistella montana]|uniref:DUF3078 domain-containing protein n=1 Tax=Kaistella montana TaxID=1849733 RepID=A0ABW5KBJ8_9FLAO|nr:DUF3078 domain-containing protein [Kaistella montana]MCQ4035769.1 DUF3078 domain-containing protein [Kaistella montana]
MRKFIAIILLFFAVFVFAQRDREILKEIDSISQRRWDSVSLDLDSLSNPKLINFDRHFKDTIVIRDKVVMSNLTQELPITPYNMLKLKDPIKWFYYGSNNLVFNQSSFSNWNSGGNNNIGIIGKINYNLSYKNNKHFLDNTLQMGYGFVASQGESSRKTEDYMNLMTNYGYDIGKDFYLSTGFQFLSQFSPGFNYTDTPDPEFKDRVSRFMSPGYLNAGLGISYNPNEDFQVIFRPVNGKFTFITDPLLQKAGKYGLEKDGQSVRSELGALVNVLYRLKIYKDINLVNQINFFSNYIFHPERVDIAYNGTLNIRFNKFISTVVSLDLLYDHDQLQKLQMKQTLGVGFSYNLGFENKEKNKKLIKPFVAD